MRRIIPLELVGQDSLSFDIYNENGDFLYPKGELLTPKLLIQLCHIKIYARDENQEEQRISKYKSVISEQVSKTLVNFSKNLINIVIENKSPDNNVYNEACDIISEEVSRLIEKIECASQLKIVDEYMFSHMVNVSALSCAIGIILGFDNEEVKEIALGGFLHDIGKALVPQDILNKPDKLDEDEFEIMKSHTLLGYRYIKENLNLPEKIAKVALDHQENYSGGGYPYGLKGNEINLYAQITAVADVYDALTSNKVYKRAVDSDTALDIMLKEDDHRFNPYILTKFMQMVDYKNKKSVNIKREAN
jgi:putative nucleotidyltransferase with HDIG domain